VDAVRFGHRALEIATHLNDEGLAYGARFALGQSCWIGGDNPAANTYFTANLPENVRDMSRVRDFGTAGSLPLDSMSILGSTLAHCGEFERAFTILRRAQAIPTRSAFDFVVVRYHFARAHLHRGDAHLALPISRAAVEHAIETGVRFTLPWNHAMLGYAYALVGDLETGIQLPQQACETSKSIHLPYLTALSSVLRGETLASRQPEQALDVAEGALCIARTNGFRAQEAELLRVKAAALARQDPNTAGGLVNESLSLAKTIGLAPEEGHCLRTLGDISAARRDSDAASRFYELARAKYQRLGMIHWLRALA
jgi:tetratricopeptide (TPR) repeat protein